MNKVEARSNIYSSFKKNVNVLKNQQSIEPDLAKIARLKALIDALNVNK